MQTYLCTYLRRDCCCRNLSKPMKTFPHTHGWWLSCGLKLLLLLLFLFIHNSYIYSYLSFFLSFIFIFQIEILFFLLFHYVFFFPKKNKKESTPFTNFKEDLGLKFAVSSSPLTCEAPRLLRRVLAKGGQGGTHPCQEAFPKCVTTTRALHFVAWIAV